MYYILISTKKLGVLRTMLEFIKKELGEIAFQLFFIVSDHIKQNEGARLSLVGSGLGCSGCVLFRGRC